MSRKRPATEPPDGEDDDILRSTVQLLLSCTSARQSLSANSEIISECLQATGHLVQLLALAHVNAEFRTNAMMSEGRHLSMLGRAMAVPAANTSAAAPR